MLLPEFEKLDQFGMDLGGWKESAKSIGMVWRRRERREVGDGKKGEGMGMGPGRDGEVEGRLFM